MTDAAPSEPEAPSAERSAAPPTPPLHGKTAFVAGGTSGINLGIALALAGAGAHVGVLSRDAAKVAAAVARLQALGARASGSAADVRDFDAVDQALRRFHAEAGALDIVVSGAAGNFIAPAAALSSKGFRTVVDIDLVGSFHVFRAAHPLLRRPGASLIAISAPQSTEAVFGQCHAAAAKAGLDALVRSLAVEWGPEGTRVNAIVPGPIADTEGLQRLTAMPAWRDALQRSVPLRRFGRADEVGALAVFLAGDAASYITGAVIPCDGGSVLTLAGAMAPGNLGLG
jgi:NAD(P)-dependent dehydrogenase (short-subunit alcohol dehydrogenase family)